MSDYSSLFNSSAYSSAYAGYHTSLTPEPAAASYYSAGYGTQANSGTTYTAYNQVGYGGTASAGGSSAYNTPASSTAASSGNYNYMDWASAATAAAMSSVISANTPSPKTGSSYSSGHKNTANVGSKPYSRPTWSKKKTTAPVSAIDAPKTYYCEICKISCMGSLTFKEHCNGQKHKKKEKEKEKEKETGEAVLPKPAYGFGKIYKCELCEVLCTGEQAFNAHMSGAKHSKTVLLFKRLGKSIPSPTCTNAKGEKTEVSVESIREELVKRAEKKAKEEKDRAERMEKRQQEEEERARVKIEEIETRRVQMEERRAKWEEERWKREEEWRRMQERSEEAWKEWQEAEQAETAPHLVQAGNASRDGPNLDNSVIMALHEQIYPEQSELNGIKKLVQVTEDHLKTISDAMRDETEKELKDKGLEIDTEEGVETRVLKGCLRLGDLANGLILRGDTRLDLLVFCTDKPTVYMLQNVMQKFQDLLTETQRKVLEVKLSDNKVGFSVSDPEGYSVTITMSSKAMEEELTSAIVTADIAAKVLDRSLCMKAIHDLKHAQWFGKTISGSPSAVIALRILHHLFRSEEMDHWREAVTKRILHVIVGEILTANPIRRLSPGDVIRRVLETIAAGVLYPAFGSVKHPDLPDLDLTKDLPIETVEKVTMEAQAALRALTANKIHEFLKVPEAPAEPVQHFPAVRAPAEEGYDGAPGYPGAHPHPAHRPRYHGPPPPRYGGPPPHMWGPPPPIRGGYGRGFPPRGPRPHRGRGGRGRGGRSAADTKKQEIAEAVLAAAADAPATEGATDSTPTEGATAAETPVKAEAPAANGESTPMEATPAPATDSRKRKSEEEETNESKKDRTS